MVVILLFQKDWKTSYSENQSIFYCVDFFFASSYISNLILLKSVHAYQPQIFSIFCNPCSTCVCGDSNFRDKR